MVKTLEGLSEKVILELRLKASEEENVVSLRDQMA